MKSWTWRQVWQRRLDRHWLREPAPAERMLDVAADVCGIHAQVMPSAELSLGLRVRGIARADIRAALWQDRTLVKTYGLRGTVHLFPTRELSLWLAALRTKPPPREPNRFELEAVPSDRRDELIHAIHGALDGRQLTREELGAELERQLGSWASEEVFPAFGGHWPRKVLQIRVDTFAPLSRQQKEEAERQAARIGEILELPAEVAFGAVEPRGHL
jgi:Winged helix DNA-binding domain